MSLSNDACALDKHTRIAQIVAYDGVAFDVKVVDSLPDVCARGAGFGSTGAVVTCEDQSIFPMDSEVINFVQNAQQINGEHVLQLAIDEDLHECDYYLSMCHYRQVNSIESR